MDPALLDVALDLAANLGAEDRYRKLATAVRRVVPCDATALLELRDGVLVPVVASGLQPDVVGRRFLPSDHPRLMRLLAADGPVRFTGSDLPDPFDGLFVGHEVTVRAHACMGCPLRVEGGVIGVLAVDAVDPAAFDGVDDGTVAMLAALAGAAMRTASLIGALEAAATRQGLVARQLLQDRRQQAGAGGILGVSAAVRRIRDEVALIAGSDLPVLIMGETGVGKDVVAHAVHGQSARRDAALIQVNCAALPEGLAESELFGHVRGAFTGATDTRAGKFEVADGGTLFLDEVGELPLVVQPKLLRAIQSGEVQRVGADRPVHVDVRIVAATNRDLGEEVRAGRFRSDLFHRLAVYPLHLPPLRERPEDVPVFAGYFLDRARARLGLGEVRLTANAHEALAAHDWPGNVRELDHVVLRAALRASSGRRHETVVVDAPHLGLGPAGSARFPAAGEPPPFAAGEVGLRAAVEAYERRLVVDALARSGGSFAAAARILGMDRGNLHRLARRLGVP